MTLGQMNSKMIKAQEAETHLGRALLCRALLEDAVDFIYSKVGAKKPSKARDLPLVKLQDPGHRLQSRRLSRSVMSDKAIDLSLRNMKCQIIHRFFISVFLCKMFNT